MNTILTVDEAQLKFKELVDKLAPGDEIVIIKDLKPVAKIVWGRTPQAARPAPGLGKGGILYMAPDFDEPLDDFKEYTE